jgi:hypothetical protein
MVSDDSKWRPALLVTISALGFLIAFVLAWMWPGTIRVGGRICLFVLAAFFVGIPILSRVADRHRIRRHIEDSGGRMLRVRALPFWKQDWTVRFAPTRFEVWYHDLLGNLHFARVRTSMARGLMWDQDDVVATGTPEHPAGVPPL